MQQHQLAYTRAKMFTASEVAEFEYCPLIWWHEQFETWAHADNEELFARLVELEHEHGAQAPALPEYRMIEQLLLRHGAFDENRQQPQQQSEAGEDFEAEVELELSHQHPVSPGRSRSLVIAILGLGLLALLLIVLGLFLP